MGCEKRCRRQRVNAVFLFGLLLAVILITNYYYIIIVVRYYLSTLDPNIDCLSNMSTREENSRKLNQKREDYIDWEHYFMATAFLAAKRSKDPVTQVGACIVNDENVIVGIGYNGFPKGCSDNVFPWGKHALSPLDNKFFYVCHAEVNAILNRNSTDTKGCRLYVALFPCNECAKFIIQSGIKEVIYMSNKNFGKLETIAAKKMFDAVGIKYRQFVPKQNEIVIDFNEIDWDTMSQLPPTPKKAK